MNIKTGDKVKILTGKDKGKTGKVLQVFPLKERASIEGLNILVKHMRPRKEGEKGQRIEFPAPIRLSNLMFVCPSCGKPTRIEHKIIATGKSATGGKKVRVCKKCKQSAD